jgi:hypothetical protein
VHYFVNKLKPRLQVYKMVKKDKAQIVLKKLKI